MNQRFTALLWATILILCIAAFGAAESAETQYMENEWNYVDGSMDVSHGIPADADGTLEKIRDRGKLRVATEPYFPPQEFIDPSKSGQEQYVGADMELARFIAERMGVELVIVPMEFSRVLEAVAEGECDLAVSALSFTPSRAERVEFSKGYYYAEGGVTSVLMIRQDDQEEITSIEDLWDKVLVAQSGSVQEAMTAENVYEYKEFRRVSSIQDVYGALQEGTADAASVDMETAQSYIASHPYCGLTLLETVQFSLDEQYLGDRVAGPKGDLQLMYFINGVIDEVLGGQYQQWYDESEILAAKLEE